MKVVLHRMYFAQATHGILEIDGEVVCYTLELPWVGNQRTISCIPEGQYPIRERFSYRFKNHYELIDVADRSLILIHPANNAKRDLKGCIAPVSQIVGMGWGSRSREALAKVMLRIDTLLKNGAVNLEIVQAIDPVIVELLKLTYHE